MKNRIAGIETEYGIFPIPQNDYDLYIPFEAGKRRHIEFACNGSRVYEDTGSHPEYAAPECIGPSDAALYDAAGAVLMHRLFAGSEYELHRLNADEYGNTFGSHENYSVQTGLMREPGISLLVPMVLPFLVTRQIFAGTGYYYDGKFMISQRAGFINSMVGTSTTNSRDRAIVNTKYEHHSSTCDRFHLILGDSNMCEYPNVLKLATTCMVLDMAEERLGAPVRLKNPVQALHDISSFEWIVTAEDGSTMHAVDVQRLYLDMARSFYGKTDITTSYYLDEWEGVLDALKDEPLSLAGELEWPTKMAILDGLDDGDKFDAHMRWHNIDPSRSLYHELRRTGDIRTCFSVDEIERASRLPPSNTRAHFRGEFVRRLPEDAKFQGVIDWGSIGGFCMPDPFNTYEAHMGEMDELIKRLLIPAPPN